MGTSSLSTASIYREHNHLIVGLSKDALRLTPGLLTLHEFMGDSLLYEHSYVLFTLLIESLSFCLGRYRLISCLDGMVIFFFLSNSVLIMYEGLDGLFTS